MDNTTSYQGAARPDYRPEPSHAMPPAGVGGATVPHGPAGVFTSPQSAPRPASSAALAVVRGLKDYWFLVALFMSGLLAVVYMLVFEVTPWDAHAEARNKRLQTEHHVEVGYDFMERAEYQRAKSEFERALALSPTKESALSGRYLSELFIDIESADWDAAVGMSLQKRLEERFSGNREFGKRRHLIEKYLGDLHTSVSRHEEAKAHYEKALSLKEDYWDALRGYYSLVYAYSEDLGLDEAGRLRKLVELGEAMVRRDPYDYQGRHSLGYCLYEQAIAEEAGPGRDELLARATKQSQEAALLKGNEIAVLADLGEIVRHTDPALSLYYHKWAAEILEQPKEARPRTAELGVNIKLHKESRTLSIFGPDDMRAMIKFNLALDYLASHRLGGKADDLNLHRKFLSEAKKLDAEEVIAAVYEDQLKVLDMLLPEQSPAGAQRK